MSRRLATVALAGAAAVAAAALLAPRPGTAQSAAPAADERAPAAAAQPVPEVPFRGDAVAGQRVVMGAGNSGVGGACFQCHGVQGAGDAAGGFPRLAGQAGWYLYKQLQDYANGKRPNDVMTPIAIALSDAERRDAAYYFSVAQAPYAGPLARVEPALVQRGAAIAAVGSSQRGVQSCAGCHGPNGTGIAPDAPYLAGMGAGYIELQLQWWAEGKRRNDVLGVMADVAKRLTADERRALAAYYASLPPPGQP
jgi:cytochrome c553